VFIIVVVDFVIDSVRKLLGYTFVCCSFIEKDQGVEGKKNSYPVSRHHGK